MRIEIPHFGQGCSRRARRTVGLAGSAKEALVAVGMAAVMASGVSAADRSERHAAATIPQSTAEAGCPALLRQSFNRLQTGEPQSLCQFQGKVLLVVNTASYCGFTSQYEALEAIYRKYRDRGLVVVGFPSNDFSQEPGTNSEIAEFCRTTYGVEFPQFEKSSVASLAANPLYAELARQTGRKPQWNFFKFVIDRRGKPVATFGSSAEPNGRDITALIERLLAEPPAPVNG